jgi:hypothetical protein
LLGPPDPPILLLVCAYRSEDLESPCLRAFRRLAGPERACEWVTLPVLPLDEPEREELARELLSGSAASPESVAEIARQSGGLPVFVHELARHLRAGEKLGESGALSLSAVLWGRVVRLGPAARRLLEAVAVAGRPLGLSEACAAAGVEGESVEALALLRGERLVRTTPAEGGEQIEAYHDRIRETVVTRLSPAERAAHHRRLADALASAGADPEWRAVHLLGAGEAERAGELFALAAERAAEALAFDRAARLYRQALTHRASADAAQRRRLRVRLGEALALSGHAAAAAAELQAVAEDGGPDALDLLRRAALLLLSSGHVDEGMKALRRVLSSVGLSLCGSPRSSFWSLVWQRLRLRLRGLGYTLRKAEDVPAELLRRQDVCDTAATGLTMVDTIQGAYFQSLSLRLALQAGEPRRLVRALAAEGGHESAEGTRSPHRSKTLLDAAEELASRTGDAYGRGRVMTIRGAAAALAGRWAEAVAACDAGEEVLRDLPGTTWELGLAHRFGLWSLLYLGELNEVSRRLPRLLKLARERDDLYEETNLCLVVRTSLRLAADEPARARQELAEAMARWSQHGFHVQHMNRLYDDVQIDLYQNDGESARHRLMDGWGEIERSQLLRVQQVRIFLTHVRARTALALAARRPDESLLRAAARDAWALASEGAPWAAALGRLIEAGIAARRGADAAELLADAADRCEAAQMGLYAACARWLRGRLLVGGEGRRLSELAAAWMAAQRVVKCDRIAMLLVPGVLTEPLGGDPSCPA